MVFKDIPKFVINLERRPDRLESTKKELDYLGWDFELFKAIDKNSHVGCTYSHTSILKIAKERGYKEVLIVEDDCTVMPYAKSLLNKIEKECKNLEYAIFNLAPTLNRPVNRSENSPLLIDISNFPPAGPEHRGIFATNMILYHESSYDDVIKIEENENWRFYAIDDYLYQKVYQKKQSYCPILPIAPQLGNDWSDVSQQICNNFYGQTYNWNLYSRTKIPTEFLNINENKKFKEQGIHKEFIYEN